MVSDDGQAVSRRDERASTIYHIAVAISIRGGPEWDAPRVHNFDQTLGIGEVWIGVATVEVRRGIAVLGRVGAKTELFLKNRLSIGASDTGKTVKEHLEISMRSEELPDQAKVKDVLEHLDVVGRTVNHLNLEVSVAAGTGGRDVHIGNAGNLVRGQLPGHLEDLVGDGFGGRATVGEIILDAEIILGASRVVTGRQENPARSLALANNMTGGRCGQDTVLADQELLDSVRGANLCDCLDDFGVPEPPVTANDEKGAFDTLGDREQDARDKSLAVVGLLEDSDLFTKPRPAAT